MSFAPEIPAGLAAPGFSIAVPGDWIIVDLELAQQREVIEELVNKRLDDGLLRLESREEAIRAVTRLAQEAVHVGLRFASILVSDDNSGPVLASVTVATAFFDAAANDSNAAAVEADSRGTSDSFFQELGATLTERDVSSEGVRLPAGPAVRVQRNISRPLSDSMFQDVYSVQYVVPVNDEGSALVVTGTSPAIRRKDDLDQIFGEIAETLEIDPVT